MDAVLAKLDRCQILLADCHSSEQALRIADLAEAARVYAKRVKAAVGTVNKATYYKTIATKKFGEIERDRKKAKGGRPATGVSKRTKRRKAAKTRRATSQVLTTEPTQAELGISKELASQAAKLVGIPDAKIAQAEQKATEEGREFSTADVLREKKHEQVTTKIQALVQKESAPPTGKFDVLVIDPPWAMEKIEREVRPNQVLFDYPTMTEEELAVLPLPMVDDCHVWLWTTHKFLPMALRLLAKWNLKYVCTFVWHKPGGFQPIGLPQYNCEFALYARQGAPIFADTKKFNVCFEAPRGAHSEKPEEFYSLVRRVTAGRRLDMFNRRPIEGFASWGKEAVHASS